MTPTGRPLRIGVDVSCWLNRRGFGRYTRELIRALLALDDRNEYVLFLDSETARASTDLPPTDEARRVIVGTAAAAAQAASAVGRRSYGDLWRMRRAVTRHGQGLDVFLFPSLYTFFPIKTRAKVVVTKHDMTDLRYPDLLFPSWRARLFWRLKVALAVRRADLMVTVSETSKRDILDAFGLPDDGVRVVPDAVDPAFHPVTDRAATERVLRAHGIGPNQRFLLYVGGISPHKNLETLVRAFAQLEQRGETGPVKLVLVGDFERDVFYSSYLVLRELITGLALEGRVVFTGFVSDSDLIHLYGASEALVLPSLWEGFGLPALEAMACGAPVVASRAGALPEVVAEAGLLFDPLSTEQLADCLQQLLSDADLGNTLRAKGRARALGFRWEESAKIIRRVLEEAAAS